MAVITVLLGQPLLKLGVTLGIVGMRAQIVPKQQGELLGPAARTADMNMRPWRTWRLAEVALGTSRRTQYQPSTADNTHDAPFAWASVCTTEGMKRVPDSILQPFRMSCGTAVVLVVNCAG